MGRRADVVEEYVMRIAAMRQWARPWIVLGALWLTMGTAAGQNRAPVTAENVFPDTTKLFVSIPDPSLYRTKWQQTELAKLFDDPAMEAFGQDLRRQLDEKLTQTARRLGLTLSDLDGVAGGEVAFGLIRSSPEKPLSVAVLVNVSGKQERVAALQQKVRQELLARRGQEQAETRDGYTWQKWTFPPTRDNPAPAPALFARHGDWLVAGDHAETILAMLQRLDGRGNDVLAKLPAYRQVMARTGQGSVKTVHLRWFVVPLELAQAIKDAQRQQERGRDKVRILREQGFDCLQGVGGVLEWASGEMDSRYEVYVYAPQNARVLAARMLSFPTTPPLVVPPWASADASGFLMANWNMAQAFEASKTLVDSLAGSEVFEDALRDIELDPNGLRVNIRKEFIAYLGTRVYILTRHSKPITPQSEQRLMAFELTDPQRVAATLARSLPRDPNVKIRKFGNQTVWEIVRKQNVAQARGQGFQGFRRDQTPDNPNSRMLFKNGAMAVGFGYLFVASDVDFLGDFLVNAQTRQKLTDSSGYQLVENALRPLGAVDQECARYYVHLAEALETDYELFRLGKMVDSETLLGQLLNYFLAPDEEGLKRKPLLDGSKLPEFSKIRQHLYYGGFRVFADPEGWRIAGGLLARDQRRAARHE